MTFEQTYELGKGNQLLIQLPENFRKGKKVRVIIEEVDEDREQKIKMLSNAATDPLFANDVNEVREDFKYTDTE